MLPVTIAIPARDASRTIGRAVRSAAAQDAAVILLVDDWSADRTVEAARAACPTLRVLKPIEHRALGFTRQAALNVVETPWLVWLDADDEMLPGRTTALVRALEADGADLGVDPVELVDGETGQPRGTLPIPTCLTSDPTWSRLFERNYLPAPGPIAVRTSTAREIGYDVQLHGGEDIDFLLRCVARGTRGSCLDWPGYRQHAYADSLSRRLANQRAMYARALTKHAYGTVRSTLLGAGWSERIADWAVVSMATFRGDYGTALAAVEALGAVEDHATLETEGPCPMPEAWRVAFHRGTLLLLTGKPDAAAGPLEQACRIAEAPEALNNLGVAYASVGRLDAASTCFRRAIDLWPGYADAAANVGDHGAHRLTTHPLRRSAFRDDYSGPARSTDTRSDRHG